MRFYTTSDLGPSRQMTHDGFLICNDAVLARCGIQHYGPGETSLTGDFVRIERLADDVFHPEAVASCNGKPVVIDHPQDGFGQRIDVTPKNWRDLVVGHAQNPRRSADDFLVADLVIYDQDAIDLINSGMKRQLSCGYDAQYEEMGPNYGRQRDIRINHVAIVDLGRCGPLCAINDAASPNESGANRELVSRETSRLRLHGRPTLAALHALARDPLIQRLARRN